MELTTRLLLTMLIFSAVASCKSSSEAPSMSEAVAQCEQAFVSLGIEDEVGFVSVGAVPEGYPLAADAIVCSYQGADTLFHSILLRADEPPVLLPDEQPPPTTTSA